MCFARQRRTLFGHFCASPLWLFPPLLFHLSILSEVWLLNFFRLAIIGGLRHRIYQMFHLACYCSAYLPKGYHSAWETVVAVDWFDFKRQIFAQSSFDRLESTGLRLGWISTPLQLLPDPKRNSGCDLTMWMFLKIRIPKIHGFRHWQF